MSIAVENTFHLVIAFLEMREKDILSKLLAQMVGVIFVGEFVSFFLFIERLC